MRRRIRFQTQVGLEQFVGLGVPSAPAQGLGTGVVPAQQMRIELCTPDQPLGRPCVVGRLQVYNAEKIGGVGVLRVVLDDVLEVPAGRIDLAQVVMQDSADVQRAGLVGILFEHLCQDAQREAFIALVLTVEDRDGEIDACVEPIWGRIDHGFELRDGGCVVVLPHKRHGAVVASHDIGLARGQRQTRSEHGDTGQRCR